MTSFFQSYFQASSMPKRLLQYALSKLEILDTDALGLDKLDIALGRNSTVEFRDVGLRLKKLQTLLQLPPTLEVLKARVLLLRVTIPVDLYSSAILVEVEGVETQLRVKPTSEATSRTDHDRKRKRPSSKHSSIPTTHTKPDRPRGSEFDEDDNTEPAIPSAVDLAQSFLQTEPEAEKAELEAALLSETQEFGASSALSDDGEFPVGTGATLSLPAFMARFLQGMLDRLQVRIHGVVFNLDIDLPNEASKLSSANPTDPVTISLKVDDIDIEGVTVDFDKESDDGVPTRTPLYKKGKKLISLSHIRGTLISEAAFFSSLSRSSALSSPLAAHSDISEGRRSIAKSVSSTRSSMMQASERGLSPDRSSDISSSRLSQASAPRTVASSQPLQASVVASDSGRFEDAPEEDLASNVSGSIHEALSEMGDSVFQSSAYLDQVAESQFLDENEEGGPTLLPSSRDIRTSIRHTSPLSTPRASIHLPPILHTADIPHPAVVDHSQISPTQQSTMLPSRARPRYSEKRISQSQPTLPVDLNSPSTGINDLPHASDVGSAQDSEAIEDETASTPPGVDDLTQSQLFSHEDAESMYMSAISHTSSISKLPGGWSNSSSGSEDSRSPPFSPKLSGHEEPLDNLEHARHTVPEQDDSEDEILKRSSTSDAENPATPRRLSFSTPQVTRSQNILAVPQSSSDASERSTTSSEEYSRLRKQFFSIDRVDIYVPSSLPETASNVPDVDRAGSMSYSTASVQSSVCQSTSVNVPGAFSTHLPTQRAPLKQNVPRSKPATAERPEEERKDDSIEVLVGDISAQFDVSIGRLMFKIVQQLKEAVKPSSISPPPKTQEISERAFKLSVQEISLKFLERLEGTLGSASPIPPAPSADVLLRTTFNGLRMLSQVTKSSTTTSVTLEKFVFGYAKENIISFDASLQMRSSVRDLKASDGIDISVNITQTADITRCEVVTLPLHVSIDLQKLDETFSWFGGLSSVLNLGSSIASNATVTVSPGKPKPRGVRFEAPIRPDDKSVANQNKADVRIGGFILDLVGTECSVGIETSAVKVVSRDEGVGLSIQKLRLSGPHLKHSNEEPPISVDVTSTRIEYLMSPKDADLDRLLALITPSKAKYDQDDDILLDTLLRQRKQGAVLRITVDDVQTRIGRLHELNYLPELGEEVARLATVAKYLPDDERPGLLSLIALRKFEAHVDFENDLGTIQLSSSDIEVAQITLPALAALSIGSVSARRNTSEILLGMGTDPELREPRSRSPAIMARMIGDEMEPVVRVKVWNLKVEYRVPTVMVLLGLTNNATAQDVSASLNASVATLRDLVRPKAAQMPGQDIGRNATTSTSKPMTVDVVLRDCVIGLNPLGLPSKVLFVLTESHVTTVLPKDGNTKLSMDLSKASILIIDDVANLLSAGNIARTRRSSFDGGSAQVADLCATGYVSVSYISSAKAIVQMTTGEEGENSIDVELRDDLFVLESCADSTQTLVAVLNGLSPPTPPSKATKYRTKIIPVHDLLASLSGDAFGTAEGEYNFDDDFGIGEGLGGEFVGDEEDDLEFDSHYYQNEGDGLYGEVGSSSSTRLTSRDVAEGVLLESFVEPQKELENEELEFQEDHFGTGSILEGTAHRWNSAKNTYDRSNVSRVRKSPLKVCVRDVHIIWNLFDGYDWQHTRDTISKAVQDVESKAIEKRARNERRPTFDQDIEDEETVIGDFLFNSIYIGIPANRDPRELAAAINQELNDNATETESVAFTSVSASPSRQGGGRRSTSKKLRLSRSKHHKITFELRGVSVDLVAFPPGSGETQSSVDIRVRDFEIFDHVPTSTWRKFATYMQDAGERETGTSMIHIEILNVKPIPDLAASEIVLKATVLPLRLHVDQDALDFITRFFEFKDDSAPKQPSPGDVPFLQRVEVNSVQVKLDFKPKRVDYAGLRSGHTTEFMNFLILDEADMVLRHTIIYGISGFDKLGKCLNDIWMPDIKRNQLPGILAGLAPVRSIVNVGEGFRHLFVVPMREYKKDGRIVRGISKGAAAFAKTTGTELVKLGAKVAIGVQTVLQGAEDFLGPNAESKIGIDDEESDEESKQISLYANQPVGVLQGLRGGYNGLQRDLVLARDAIIAVPGEVMESGNAAGVMRAVRKHAPTVILRPAIGVAKAGGQILMGATNALDPANLKRADAKYKKH
ncbi:probable Autophagy-related protein 2 [Phialocephala subalpina]|uniref:Autophagy-related protein 2 n=1 Tax=Phialocephala subalpina TaxID=576137 RepID=A0A1L7WK00_9HELO|nr:probable Autophagy-related protein 2 [Phialocephala subalpina]